MLEDANDTNNVNNTNNMHSSDTGRVMTASLPACHSVCISLTCTTLTPEKLTVVLCFGLEPPY